MVKRSTMIAAVLWIGLGCVARAEVVNATSTNPVGPAFTTTVDTDLRTVRYDFDLGALPYAYEQINVIVPNGLAVIYWTSSIDPDNPKSPGAAGFILGDDSGLQFEYSTASEPPAVNWIEFHYRPEYAWTSFHLPDAGEDSVQVTYREPPGGFPPGLEDNVDLIAYAPLFAAAAAPGQVADLAISRNPGSFLLDLTWGASCSVGATQYIVHEGSLSSLRMGIYDHSATDCFNVPNDLQQFVFPPDFDTYYVVVPVGPESEGSYGTSFDGANSQERPVGLAVCRPTQEVGCP